MNLNNHNFCDGWGWYIDIENNDINNNNNNMKINFNNKSYKKINYHLNRLETIEEDEYDYYKDINEINIKNDEKKHQHKITGNGLIIKIGSTTLLTALLTYFVFFIL